MASNPPLGSCAGPVVRWGLFFLVFFGSLVYLWSNGFLSTSSLIDIHDFWAHNPIVDSDLATPLGDVADLVNVFIGTAGNGHVFPGATLPHGMVKAGMDTDGPGAHAGYQALPKFSITGFSQLHEDGTGGAIPLSNFKLFPIHQSQCDSTDLASCPVSLDRRKVPRATNPYGSPQDTGSPGYFKTILKTDVQVELTATRRTALHRYTFPNISDTMHIIVDVANDGQRSGSNSELNIDINRARVTAAADFAASFGGGRYRAYACVDFARQESLFPQIPSKFHPRQTPKTSVNEAIVSPSAYGVFLSNKVFLGNTSLEKGKYSNHDQGAVLSFQPRKGFPSVLLARVGVSLISIKQACRNAETEIPTFGKTLSDSTFEQTHAVARAKWRTLLEGIDLHVFDETKNQAVNRSMATLLYSSVYRSHIVPADYSEENPRWKSYEPYYDSLYCNWDTYRTLFPLLSLQDPDSYARIVRSFIDIQKHEGWLPECRGATLQQFVQGGSSGDPILAEFFVKYRDRLKEFNINPHELYLALVQDAEVESPEWNYRGRPVNAWKQYGFIPVGEWFRGGMNTRQVSRTLEYSFDDFTISQVAKYYGQDEDAAKYQNRSRGFEHVWNSETPIKRQDDVTKIETEVPGIRGFMQPRYKNGTFGYTDPRHCTVHDPRHSTCFLDAINKDGFYEGGPIVYSQYVPHDTAKLIELQGGEAAFIRRLDFIFDEGYFDSTNEPSQQIPYMYHYADKPGFTAERVRQTIFTSYNTSIWGLPGNDDSGAMGSYVAFNLLGMYPLPATKQFLISSPFFPRITIRNPIYKTSTTVIAHNFDGHSGKNIYIRSVKINGALWSSNCFIEWDVFTKPTTIELELTDDRMVPCGNSKDALPPSLSTGGYRIGF